MKRLFFLSVIFLFIYTRAACQDNYEIQIYESETVAQGTTMVELHSNYTPVGQTFIGEVRPTQDAVHETVEITHGFDAWFETGFYIFTNVLSGYGWQWVGDHIRPRVRVPESWNWPVGVSLSNEIGYQRKEYSADTWNWEIRPIVDKDFKLVYLSFNPAFSKSLKGINQNEGFSFEPGFKAAFHASPKVDIGGEYYGETGVLFNAEPLSQQSHALFAVIDLKFSEQWEFNFGMGWGLTSSTDRQVIKLILGRKFGKKKKE